MWTYDFLDRLGIATHVRYSDGAYANHAATIEKLGYLGLTRVRDTAPKPASNLPYAKYLEAGLRFSMSCSPDGAALTDASQAGEVLDRILACFPEARGIDYLEGPNEPNNQPITFGGVKDTKTSFAAVTAYMEALHRAMRSRREFEHIPLLGVANTPRLNVRSDMDNEHPYPQNGSQPGLQMSKTMAGRTRPVIMTEFGYNTGPVSKWPTPVDEDTQAVLLLNGIFDAASLGVRRLYIYELLDEKADLAFKVPNLHWGIFRFDGTPKTAARALRNLSRILVPEHAACDAACALPQATGLPATAKSLVLKKGPAATIVVLWNEPDIWDAAANRPLQVAANDVSLTFPPAKGVRLFDPMSSDRPVREAGPSASFTVRLSAFPQIVEVIGWKDESAKSAS